LLIDILSSNCGRNSDLRSLLSCLVDRDAAVSAVLCLRLPLEVDCLCNESAVELKAGRSRLRDDFGENVNSLLLTLEFIISF